LRRIRLFVTILIAGVAVAACADDDEAAPASDPEVGSGASVHTVPQLEDIVTRLRDAFGDDNQDTELSVTVGPQNQVTEAMSEDSASMAVLPGPALDDPDADAAVLGRNLAIITVPEGNPAGVTGVDAFAAGAGAQTAICGADSMFGNFAAIVVRLGGVEPDRDRVSAGCEGEAVGRVASGELDAALVFRNGVEIPEGVEVIDIPEEQNLVIDIHYVKPDGDEVIRDFAAFLESDRAVMILTQQGYLP
jgi:molybdate transport system substrate-binding protein